MGEIEGIKAYCFPPCLKQGKVNMQLYIHDKLNFCLLRIVRPCTCEDQYLDLKSEDAGN